MRVREDRKLLFLEKLFLCLSTYLHSLYTTTTTTVLVLSTLPILYFSSVRMNNNNNNALGSLANLASSNDSVSQRLFYTCLYIYIFLYSMQSR